MDLGNKLRFTKDGEGDYHYDLPNGDRIRINKVIIAKQTRWEISIGDVTVEALSLADARRFLTLATQTLYSYEVPL